MGCIQESKKHREYENIKRIAQLYSNKENIEVFLYQRFDKTWDFAEIDDPKITEAREFISPLQ